MRNPIHKRMERFEPWQHLTFMACLCERMAPNFQLFCEVTEQPDNSKVYQNILNLVWESLTVKGAKINFDNQLEKLEALKNSAEIQAELDVQWQIYRLLNECEERDTQLILELKNEIRTEGISNIGVNFNQ